MPLCNLPKPELCHICKVRRPHYHIAWCLEGKPKECFWACADCTYEYLKAQNESGLPLPMIK